MRLGDFEIHLLVASGRHPDAGTLFGVVPKAVWQRQRRTTCCGPPAWARWCATAAV